MNVLSLFDGIGTGLLALKNVGISVDNYYASEIDKRAIEVSKRHHKNIIHVGDVRNINAKDFDRIDLLIGGSPCTNLSSATPKTHQHIKTTSGKHIETLDEYLELKNKKIEFFGQSYLFWEYVRLLRELKPKYFLLENVNLLKKWQSIFDRELGVERVVINSNIVSAQDRKRFYWTNIPIQNITTLPESPLVLKDILEDDSKVGNEYDYKGSYSIIDENKRIVGFINTKGWMQSRRICNINYKSTTVIASKKILIYKNGRVRKLTPIEYERLQTLPDNYTEGFSYTQRLKLIGNGWTLKLIELIFKNLE